MVIKSLKRRREIIRLIRMLKKISNIKSSIFKTIPLEDQIHSLKFMIDSKLKEKYLDVETMILKKINNNKTKDSQKNHLDYLLHKLNKFPHKLKIFQIDYSEEEFKKICSLLDFVERDMGYV